MTSAVLATLSDVVGFLAQSFKLAAVFPAFIFALLNQLIILPHLPQKGIVADLVALDLSGKFVIAVIAALLLGYTLTIVNIPLIRLFEGYPFRDTWYGNWLTEVQQARVQRVREVMKMRIASLEEEIARLKEKAELYETAHPQREALYERREALTKKLKTEKALSDQQIRDYFPTDTALLPTALGNTVAAFEEYPWTRYGIDAVILWPRLLPTLTKENYAVYVEREKAGLDFVLNLCFLLSLLGLEMVYIGLIFSQNYVIWFVGAGFTAFFAFLFYKAAVVGAYSWGTTVRVAFDLYRYHLLRALYGYPPEGFSDEFHFWKQISQFIREGAVGEKEMSELLHYSRIQEEFGGQERLPAKGGA